MRRGQGSPDLPAKENEGFLAYLDRYARELGWIGPEIQKPSAPRRPQQRPFRERLDEIFGKARQPGEDG